MSKGINKVILIGNLGQDPETRFTPQGSQVTNLSIATDESYKDKQTGQLVPKTEWHRVAMFNKLAEIASEYLKKGAKVYIEGRLQTQKWQDQQGQDRYSTQIIANQMQMLDSRPEGNQPNQGTPQATYSPQSSPMAGNPTNYTENKAQNPPAPKPPQDDFSDDVPF